MPNELKGISARIDANLHAEIRAYLEAHNMNTAEFITLAAQDELHPKNTEKGGKTMENMRTLAFQVPESFFLRVKAYLARHNMHQNHFVIGLIADELERDEALLQNDSKETADEDETVDSEMEQDEDEPDLSDGSVSEEEADNLESEETQEDFSDEDSDVSADDFEPDEDESEEEQEYGPEM